MKLNLNLNSIFKVEFYMFLKRIITIDYNVINYNVN